MADCITNLTKQQTFRLNYLIKTYNIPLPLFSKIQKYYRQLRKFNYKTQASFSIDQLIITSIIIAQKTQIFHNMKGQVIYGEVIFLNQMIKAKDNVQAIIHILRMYLPFKKFKGQSFISSLENTIQQMEIGNILINKYQTCFSQVFFKQQKSISKGLIHKMRSFGWILLLYIQKDITITSIRQAYNLVVSIIYVLIRYTYNYVPIKLINLSNNCNRNIISYILTSILRVFKLQDIEQFKQTSLYVDNILEQLISSEILKCQNLDKFNFLHPQIIKTNYKSLDKLYSQERCTNSIDMRLFLKDRYTIFSPNKINEAVFNKKGINKYNLPFKSHKIIDFQTESIQEYNENDQKQLDSSQKEKIQKYSIIEQIIQFDQQLNHKENLETENMIETYKLNFQSEKMQSVPMKDKKKIVISSCKNKSKRYQKYDEQQFQRKSLLQESKQNAKQRICLVRKQNNSENVQRGLNLSNGMNFKNLNIQNIERDQTRMRSRPINYMVDNLNTQKTKQFNNQ